jgi:pimeloyl-ACP methyl ester carboxylesterase
MTGRIRHTYEADMVIRESPPGASGTLLYIHGLGESGICFEELMEDVRLTGWRHVAPDLPGYGRSPWRELPITLEAYADHLGRWLENREEDPVVVFGHSMGGVIGLLLCERFPTRVRGFLNIEGNISIDDCTTSSQVVAYTAEEFVDGGVEALRRTVFRQGGSDRSFRRYFASLRMCDPRCLHLNSAELVEHSQSETLAPRLAALEIPQRYLLGDPRGTGKRSRKLLEASGLEWRAIPDSGHWPFLEQPDAFADEVVAFLEDLSD